MNQKRAIGAFINRMNQKRAIGAFINRMNQKRAIGAFINRLKQGARLDGVDRPFLFLPVPLLARGGAQMLALLQLVAGRLQHVALHRGVQLGYEGSHQPHPRPLRGAGGEGGDARQNMGDVRECLQFVISHLTLFLLLSTGVYAGRPKARDWCLYPSSPVLCVPTPWLTLNAQNSIARCATRVFGCS